MEAVTVIDVPKSRRTTPPRSYQLDDAPWVRLGQVAKHYGMSRAGLTTALVLWFIRCPRARLPTRLSDDFIAGLPPLPEREG